MAYRRVRRTGGSTATCSRRSRCGARSALVGIPYRRIPAPVARVVVYALSRRSRRLARGDPSPAATPLAGS